ncbi:MAG: hypothetical protein JXM72_03800 [Deltaproteobacteria bacterium]|nr:hypothetical protein [Deltaproteobacteria bacterium]
MITFILTLIIVPFLIVRMPSDYFTYDRDNLKQYHRQHIIMRIMLLVLKNAFGYVFIFAGIAMLMLPGQGIITIFIGITLISFPKKRALECRIIRIKAVVRTINWMRARAHKGPVDLPVCSVNDAGSKVDANAISVKGIYKP